MNEITTDVRTDMYTMKGCGKGEVFGQGRLGGWDRR